jgi:hypothetical protein
MIAWLVLLLCALAILHFMYESVIAPSLLDHYRFQLFQLRDELRRMKLQDGARIHTAVFHELQDALNVLIRFADRFDFYAIARAKFTLEQDEELRARIARRNGLIDECGIAELRSMRSKIAWVGMRLAIVNSGAWYGYLFPIFFWNHCKGFVKRLVMALMMLTEQEFERVVPRSAPARTTSAVRV